jgi:tripartite ATP-independent transporter DctP family solute receptor
MRPPLKAFLFILTALITSAALYPGILHAKITLRAAQVLADTHPSHVALVRFQELLNERSKGEIQVEIADSKILGGERELIEAIQMGEVEIIVIGTAPLYGFTSDYLVFDLPYVFPDAGTARAVLDSPFGQTHLDRAMQVGLKGLTYYENGLRHISSTKKPIRLPGDLQGMRFRTMESRIHLETFRALGANPVPLSYSDLYARLKGGDLDAEENPMSVFVTGKLYEVQKYYTLTGHFYMPSPMFISISVWNKLDTADQELILQTARETAVYQRQLSDIFNSPTAIENLERSITVIQDVDKDAWKAAVAPVRKIFEAEVGQDTLAGLEKAIQDVEANK